MCAKRVADVMIDMLIAANVKRAYGIVGDSLNNITDAIRQHDALEWIHVRHEEVAAFAAGADALMSGELTVCAGSCGPGSLHLINGLFESHRNGAPVLAIASHIPSDEMGGNFPQEIKAKQLFDTCSHFCEVVTHPAQAIKLFRSAMQHAIAKRGVSVIILPGDIAARKVDFPISDKPCVFYANPVIRPDDHELEKLATLLNEADKIGVFAGAGCQGAHAEILALCEKLKAPMAHTSRSKDFVDYDNPYNVGMTGLLGIESGYHMVQNCETLLMLGTDFAYPQFYPTKARLLQIDIKGENIGHHQPVDFGVVGDIKETLTALIPKLTASTDTHFLKESQELYQKSLRSLNKRASHTNQSTTLIHPQYLTHTISQLAEADAFFTADGGSPMLWLLRHLEVNGKRRTLTSLLHGTMANAMPQAIGIKKAFPQRQVIALSGDGGIAMLLGDLLTLIQEDIDIKIIVYNNSALGFVEVEQKAEGLLDTYTDLKNPDFAKVAHAIGLHGVRIEDANTLETQLADALKVPGPTLIDVQVARMELLKPPHVTAEQAYKFGMYSLKAVLDGRASELIEFAEEELKKR
jgi:pyruvate dehydrogenase (quinone)